MRLPTKVREALANLQQQINQQGSKLQAQQELLCALLDAHPDPAGVIDRFRKLGEAMIVACHESGIPARQVEEDEIARHWLAGALDPHSKDDPACTMH